MKDSAERQYEVAGNTMGSCIERPHDIRSGHHVAHYH